MSLKLDLNLNQCHETNNGDWTIDEKAGVLETERVFDVSITQLKSSLCTDVPPSLRKKAT